MSTKESAARLTSLPELQTLTQPGSRGVYVTRPELFAVLRAILTEVEEDSPLSLFPTQKQSENKESSSKNTTSAPSPEEAVSAVLDKLRYHIDSKFCADANFVHFVIKKINDLNNRYGIKDE